MTVSIRSIRLLKNKSTGMKEISLSKGSVTRELVRKQTGGRVTIRHTVKADNKARGSID